MDEREDMFKLSDYDWKGNGYKFDRYYTSNCSVDFDYDTKLITLRDIELYDYDNDFTPKEIEMIYLKCKELGWIE